MCATVAPLWGCTIYPSFPACTQILRFVHFSFRHLNFKNWLLTCCLMYVFNVVADQCICALWYNQKLQNRFLRSNLNLSLGTRQTPVITQWLVDEMPLSKFITVVCDLLNFPRSAVENRLILDAFAQQCSRVLSLLNNGRLLEPPSSSFTSNIKLEDGQGDTQRLHCSSLGKSKHEESSSTTDPEEEAQQSHLNQQQTSAVLRIFTDSLQNYLFSGPQQQQHLAEGLEDDQCPIAEPGSGVSPPRHNLGGWGSPTPSESYGHPSSTLPEEEEEEESCCPRCLELEQEVLSLQQENEELRNKLENIPGTVMTDRTSQGFH